MLKINQEYLTDVNGKKKAVVIPFQEWEQLMEEIEELEDIRAYDAIKSRQPNPVLFEKAVKQIREGISS